MITSHNLGEKFRPPVASAGERDFPNGVLHLVAGFRQELRVWSPSTDFSSTRTVANRSPYDQPTFRSWVAWNKHTGAPWRIVVATAGQYLQVHTVISSHRSLNTFSVGLVAISADPPV